MSRRAVAAPPASWRVLAASVRGTSHARGDEPCQDAHAWRRVAGGSLALAVADGAGSAAHAEAGARLAATVAVDALAQTAGSQGWPGALDQALEAARDAVVAEAAAREVDVRELSTTLLLCLLGADGLCVAQIGDGAIIVSSEAGVRALTLPMSGEFANETVFLTSPGAVEGAQRASWRGEARYLAAFTDGLQALALKLPARTPHEPFFAPLFAFADEAGGGADAEAQLAAFLAGPRVTARSDDDITLLLVARGDA